uniref:Uncharacterized protein n=1 Tax=Rhizophora mucronata TaxID=61149 RepID=A0A2P2PKC9_RHIMU
MHHFVCCLLKVNVLDSNLKKGGLLLALSFRNTFRHMQFHN